MEGVMQRLISGSKFKDVNAWVRDVISLRRMEDRRIRSTIIRPSSFLYLSENSSVQFPCC